MSSNHLFPYKVIRILLTIFLILHITFLGLIYFITGGLYLLIPCTNFTPPHPSPPATTHLFFFIYIKILLKHYLCIIACVLGVRCCIRAFSSSGEQGHSLLAVHGHCAVHRRCGGFSCGRQALGTWAAVVSAQGLISCDAWAVACAGFRSRGAWA